MSILTEELSALDRSISAIEEELVHILETLATQSECLNLTCIDETTRISWIKKDAIKAQNEAIFSKFCSIAGIESISAYGRKSEAFSRESSEKAIPTRSYCKMVPISSSFATPI